jgi:hypothetical protein
MSPPSMITLKLSADRVTFVTYSWWVFTPSSSYTTLGLPEILGVKLTT